MGKNTRMTFKTTKKKTANEREQNYTADEKRATVQKIAKTQKSNNEQRKRAAAVTLTQMIRDMEGQKQGNTGRSERPKRSRADSRDLEKLRYVDNANPDPCLTLTKLSMPISMGQ